MNLRQFWMVGLISTCVSLAALPAAAWQPPAEPATEEPANEQPAAEAPAAAAPDENAVEAAPAGVKEQTIYIPYARLREVFEREGRGVFLPYAEFQELWKAARERTAPPAADQPPVPALITEVENEATVSRDVVRVAAIVHIEVLAKGWQRIPLGLSDAAVTSARIGDEPARLVFDPASGYQLLYENKSGEPERLELKLDFAKAYTKAPGQNSVSFQTPQAPVSRWQLTLPEAGVKVNIQPLIAATEAPADPDGDAEEKPDQTVVLAYVGAAPEVRMDWTPQAEGATGLDALVSVQAQERVRLDEGVVRATVTLAYEISRAELAQLMVRLPADYKLVNVADANVRQWSVAEADGAQTLTVQLFEPAKGRQALVLELEKFVPEDAQQQILAPVIEALGVGRQQGLLVVEVAEGLRVEATRHVGLLQVDTAELPPELANPAPTFSYRYAAVPFELLLQVEKAQPRLTADVLVDATLEPDLLALDALAVYQIERAGAFRLQWQIPAGYSVRYVRGRAAAGAAALEVDSFHVEGEDPPRLIVNLARKALGRVALEMRMERRLAEPELQAPTGKAASIDLSIPRPTEIERHSGRLILHAPESLRVNPTKIEGLRSTSFQEALNGMEPACQQPAAGTRPVLAYAFTDEATALALDVERRKPHLTARQLLVARIESGVVKFSATFFYDIRYSGVKQLRIDLPADVATEVQDETSGLRKQVIDPAPADLEEGYVAWSFSGESELAGQVTLQLTWEQRLDELEVGKSLELKLPHLKPRDVDRAWGQIVLTKAETMDVRESGEPKGLRPIDPQRDLMPGAEVTGAARAFEFHEDWSLVASVTRYQLQEIKTSSIERAALRMVVTRAGQTAVQALYRMRSASQRLAVVLPAGVQFDPDPLRVNGRRVALEQGQQSQFLIPLVGQNPDEPFLVEIRYTAAGDSSQLEFPTFPDDPAVQKVYLCVYLPEESACLASRGPWTDELIWRRDGVLHWQPIAAHNGQPLNDDRPLVNWVTEGLDLPGSPLDGFPTQGRLFVFSTLRPEPPPQGALRLSTMDVDWFRGLSLALVVVLGLLLTPTRATTRTLAVGTLLILLAMVAVFQPMLARQLVDDALLAAAAIVLMLWLMIDLLRRAKRRPAAGPPARSEPTSAAAEASPFKGAAASSTPEPAASPAEPPPSASPPGDSGQGQGGASHG